MTYSSSNSSDATSGYDNSGQDLVGGKNLSSLPVNPILLMVGAILLILIAFYGAYSSFLKSSKARATTGEGGAEAEKPTDVVKHAKRKPEDGCRTELRVRSSRKSVRFVDDAKTSRKSSMVWVTPQVIPEARVEDPSPMQGAAKDRPHLSAFKLFSQSMASLFRSLPDVESSDSSEESDVDLGIEVVLNSDETSNSDDLAEIQSAERREYSREMERNRSVSLPEPTDADGFYVGEEVEYRGKAKWKRGVVQSINPLTVKGQGNLRARKYEQVRKRRTKPRTQTELLEMDASDMTDEDYQNLMKGARRNTLFGRSALVKSMQSRSDLVNTITKARR